MVQPGCRLEPISEELGQLVSGDIGMKLSLGQELLISEMDQETTI